MFKILEHLWYVTKGGNIRHSRDMGTMIFKLKSHHFLLIKKNGK